MNNRFTKKAQNTLNNALRFAADQPYSFANISNTGRLLLVYQYLK